MNKRLQSKLTTVFMLVVLLAQTLTPIVTVFAEDITDESSISSQTVEGVSQTLDTTSTSNSVNTVVEGQDVTATTGTTSSAVASEPKTPPAATETTSTTEEASVGDQTDGKVGEEEPAEEDEEPARESTTGGEQQRDIPTVIKELGNIFSVKNMIIDGKSIVTTDDKGNVILSTEPVVIEKNSKATMDFKWDTEGLDAKDGDTASMILPDVFSLVDVKNESIIIEDGTVVGTYSIFDGLLTFVFNEKIQKDDVSKGFVNFEFEFSLEKFTENIEQKIPLKDEAGTTIPVIMRPEGNLEGIVKSGNPDSAENAKEIIWTIDVVNTTDKSLLLAEILDRLPAGLGEPRDFVVTELGMKLNGDKVLGATIPGEYTFPITFENIVPFSGYRIEYKTTIEDKTITQFTNDATFKYGDVILPAEATVSVTRSNSIEKSGKVEDEKTIDWTIAVNKDGEVINNAIIKDMLPKGVTIVPGTIQVKKNETLIDPQPLEFPIELGDITADEVYTIDYQTEIDYTIFNKGEYQAAFTVQNTAELWIGGEEPIAVDDAMIEIKRDPILEKIGGSNVNYDPATQMLTWTVIVNKAQHPLGKVTVTDVIPEGLEIKQENIKLTGGKNAQPYSGKHNVVVNGQNITINFDDLGTDTVTITYTTKIKDAAAAGPFKNKVGLGGVGVGDGGKEIEVVVTPPVNTFLKGNNGVDYEKQIIKWQITASPIREGFKDFVITDTFENHGMIALPESFKVTIGEKTLVKGTDYVLDPIGIGYQNGFTIKFKEDVVRGGLLKILYETSFDPQREVEGQVLIPHDGDPKNIYHNKVNFTGTTDSNKQVNINRESKVTIITESWNSGKKEGKLVHVSKDGTVSPNWVSGAERFIEWDVYINYKEQKLGSGVSVTDTLDYDGKIDHNTIVVQEYTVSANGKTKPIPVTELKLETDYTVSGEGKELVVTFVNEVSKRYMIRFRSTVPAISLPAYTNKATLKVGTNEYPYTGTVSYGNHDQFLEKGPVNVEGGRVYTGDEIDWKVTVNKSLSIIANVVITDTISAGHVYLNDSLVLYYAGKEQALVKDKDYTVDVVPVKVDDELTGETKLIIKLTEELTEALVMNYKTIVTETDGQISNKVFLESIGISVETIETNKIEAKQFSSVGGIWSVTRGAIKVRKLDTDTDKVISNNEATFTLSYDINGQKVLFGEYETTKGILDIRNLPFRTYYLEEKVAPKGYVRSDEIHEIIIDTAIGKEEGNLIFVERDVKNIKEKIDIKGIKKWDGGPKPDIQLQLMRGTSSQGDPVSLDGSEKPNAWEYNWTALDKTDIDGKAYEYTVKEVKLPENYVLEPIEINNNEMTITNKYVMPIVKIGVSKTWSDANNQDGKRPESITVKLLADGKDVNKTLILNDANKWSDHFSELPKFDTENKFQEIKYSVQEEKVDSYEVDINTEDPMNIVLTNTHVPEMINLLGVKTWNDVNNQDGKRPKSITVNLLANDKVIESKDIVAVASNAWEYTFNNLPKYHDGKEIVYTVTEEKVLDYETTLKGMNITNSYIPEVTNVDVIKKWNDANNQDGKRPESITVRLFAGATEVDTHVLSEENGWRYQFDKLPVYQSGEKVKYHVIEDTVEEYSTTITSPENNVYHFDIVNSYTPGKTSVNVIKNWVDQNNKYSLHPESITVRLLANGTEIKDKVLTLTEKNDWQGSFEDLDTHKAGKLIEYTITEDTVTGYTTTIDQKTKIITNTLKTTEVSVSKGWSDFDNKFGLRPESIKVHLLQNGKRFAVDVVDVATITPNNADEWTYTFKDLPKYDTTGKEYGYTVAEETVPGYTTSIVTPLSEVEGLTSFNIVNTLETTEIPVTKKWSDFDNEYKLRPEAITVRLLQNDKEIAQVLAAELTADEAGNWSHVFRDLPTVDSKGTAYVYTIKEDTVTGYETTIDQTTGTITNTLITTNVTGKKVWEDNNDKLGLRPDSITVNLLQNGKQLAETKVTVDKDGNWHFTFENLPKVDNAGKVFEYTVTENAVEGYTVKIEGTTITNTVIPKEKPTKPTKPSKPVNPTKPTGKKDDKLPQMGEVVSPIFGALGFALVASAGTVMTMRRRKKQ